MFPNAPVLVARFLGGVPVSRPEPPPIGRPGLLLIVMGEPAFSGLLICNFSSCVRIGAEEGPGEGEARDGGESTLLDSILRSWLPLPKLVPWLSLVAVDVEDAASTLLECPECLHASRESCDAVLW